MKPSEYIMISMFYGLSFLMMLAGVTVLVKVTRQGKGGGIASLVFAGAAAYLVVMGIGMLLFLLGY